MKNRTKALLATALLVPAMAYAEFKDGNKLLAQLRGDSMDYVHALGYVIGIYDALQGVTHCPPANVTAGQVADMVRQHLEAAPSLRHLTGDRHVSYVLKRAWPCADSRRNNRDDSL